MIIKSLTLYRHTAAMIVDHFNAEALNKKHISRLK